MGKNAVVDFKHNPSAEFKDIAQMSEDEAQREIQALREGVEYHNYLYYIKNQPEISDALYDKLFKRLQELEEAFPKFQSDSSPTRRVGAPPVSRLNKVRHTAPMLSLNAELEGQKIKEFNDFIHRNVRDGDTSYVLEPKFDGASIEIVYENGSLKYGATRGDGETGEEITHNIRTVHMIPLNLPGDGNPPDYLAVRAEIFMPREGFDQLNKEKIERGEEPFANPRNAAAGMIRQYDSRNVAGRPFDVRFYDVLDCSEEIPASHWETLHRFEQWGLKTDPHNKKVASFDEIQQVYENLSEERESLAYEIDGLVIKLDNRRQREALGTRERSPRWAIAWKFPPKEEITRIRDIVVQVGRTGMLTPVALLDPVDVSGVTVSRATLHNEDEVHRKDVRVGDSVRIARAGDVIPEVVGRAGKEEGKRSAEFRMPANCPVCGTETVREGAYYVCPAGLACPAQLTGHIIHYASRDALDIDGLSEKTAGRLVELGLVKDIADLYHLTAEDFLQIEGFAEKSSRQLYEAIQSSRKTRLDRFLYGLGIRHVGLHTARVLAAEFPDLERIRQASLAELERIPDIGGIVAASIRKFFDDERNKQVLKRLLDAGMELEPVAAEGARPLEAKTFVFTGRLENYTRSEAQELVESLGGHSSSSVSANTDFVVAGEDAGSKLEEAKKHGVKILDEPSFQDMIAQASKD
ncbi:MAG: NAD-dependent DNA ligase LigA [Dehalococcoidia bacterium]